MDINQSEWSRDSLVATGLEVLPHEAHYLLAHLVRRGVGAHVPITGGGGGRGGRSPVHLQHAVGRAARLVHVSEGRENAGPLARRLRPGTVVPRRVSRGQAYF